MCRIATIPADLRFLFRVTLRRLDLATEIYHIREPEKLALVMSADEIKRLLAMAASLKTRVLLSLGYGCGLRAGEIVRLKVKHIDRAQNVIRIEQSKGRKDRHVMLSDEMLGCDATDPRPLLLLARKTAITRRQRAAYNE
jgi:site-specific recombinase XerD